jgi:hypothetical protein
MNDLSMMLYWADVLPKFGGAAGFAFSMLGIFGGVLVGLLFVDWDSDSFPRRALAAGFMFAGLCWTIALATNFIPSRSTFYMIAASEAGETVITNPETIELFGQLKDRIKRELGSDLARAPQASGGER